jgi:hypothetical protein
MKNPTQHSLPRKQKRSTRPTAIERLKTQQVLQQSEKDTLNCLLPCINQHLK